MFTTIAAAAEPDPQLISSVSNLGHMVGWLILMFGILATLAGGMIFLLSITQDTHPRWGLAVFGVVSAGAGLGVQLLTGGTSDTPAETAPTPTLTPTQAAPTPSAPREPADLTWLLVTAGIIGILLLVVLLVWVVVVITGRARRSVKASRDEAASKRAARDRVAQAWQGFHDQHDELLRKILHAETDWDALFFTPALSDPSVPTTYAMLRAMRDANTLRDVSPAPLDAGHDVDLTQLPYPAAVARFALAWDAAERHARKLGQKSIPQAERKIIRQIRTLLDIAENTAASQTERDLAYRRVQGLLEQIKSIQIPDKAIARLEQRQRLMITAGTDS